MAISKRLRFEILRRDNHSCRYCGATAPEAKILVDHVVPEALGGQSVPDNLVAACEPCNSGKSSVAPDAAVASDVYVEDDEAASEQIDRALRRLRHMLELAERPDI